MSRLIQYLDRVGLQLHGQQYGFRRGRSTIDAIKSAHAEFVVEESGVLMTVSLDIANVFNTLPWEAKPTGG